MSALGTNILSALIILKRYVLGPRLIRIFPASGGSSGRDYDPSNLEFLSELFLTSVSYAVSLSVYASPVMACYIYKKGMTTASHMMYITKFIAAIGASVVTAHIVRGIGRCRNPDYRCFLEILLKGKKDPSKRDCLQQYDFEFFAWPVDFRWNDSSLCALDFEESAGKKDRKSYFRKLLDSPLQAVEYFIAHCFARPLIYPGSVKLLQNAFAEPLKTGRAYLIEKNGRRAKLLAEDGNEIDTMFLDKRNRELNGSNLVICAEGNAAFYELGCMTTPRIAGYSVLGWNHPGFSGSSGTPFPEAERKAIDVVVKYAVTKLGFQFNEIILFGWSIGGFSLSYAAMAYPQIKAVIIDATFDSILPLAKIKMPAFASSFVERVIENYFPLNVEKQLLRYPGPIRLIRRLQEEIITTQAFRPGTNRANFLLIAILRQRYPNIMTDESVNAVGDFLAAKDFTIQDEVKRIYNYHEESCQHAVENYFKGKWPLFPSPLGDEWDADFRTQVALFLVSKYMDHFDATHCTPLPSTYFRVPWRN